MENEYKGDLKGFPKEVVERMLDLQEEQGNKRDVSVFERDRCLWRKEGGFIWDHTPEGYGFWNNVIRRKDFALFFKKYPKGVEQKEPENVFIPLPEKEMLVWDYRPDIAQRRVVFGRKKVDGHTYYLAWNDSSPNMVVTWKNAEEIPKSFIPITEAEEMISKLLKRKVKIV